jgi:hypothetical protein
MRSRAIALLIGALLTMRAAEASADWTVRPFFGTALAAKHGFVDLEQTSGDAKSVFGAAAGWHPNAIGFEFEVATLPGFFEGPAGLVVAGDVTTLMGNVTWQLPKPHEPSRFRIYVAGGAGVMRAHLDDRLGAYTSKTTLGAGNAGGGVRLRMRPRIDLDIDVRYFKTQYGDAGRAGFTEEFVSFTRLTGGVLLRF